MTEAKRAEFLDPSHPLKTLDPAAQAGVVERIELARNTGTPRRRGKDANTQTWDGSIWPAPKRFTRPRMGERPKLRVEDIGKAWGVSKSTASNRIKHPESLDVNETLVLAHALGVTLEWLRGWTDKNAYGRYEENPQIVARLYERLSPDDKETICRLLTSLVGEDAAGEVYEAENSAYMDAWAIAHPEAFEPLKEFAALFTPPPEVSALLQELQEHARATMARQLEPLPRAGAAVVADAMRPVVDKLPPSTHE